MTVAECLDLLEGDCLVLGFKRQLVNLSIQLQKSLLILLSELKIGTRISFFLLPQISYLLLDTLDGLAVLGCQLPVVLLFSFSGAKLPSQLKLREIQLGKGLLVMVQFDFTSLEGSHGVEVDLTQLRFGLRHPGDLGLLIGECLGQFLDLRVQTKP